jgi:hypothetical protein
MKAAHREYMSAQFDAWIVEHPGQAQDWNPKFTLGAMKPHICSFAKIGLATIKTPEMRLAIQSAFAKDGHFEQMRCEESQKAARTKLAAEAITPESVEVPDGQEIEMSDSDDSSGDDGSETEEPEARVPGFVLRMTRSQNNNS